MVISTDEARHWQRRLLFLFITTSKNISEDTQEMPQSWSTQPSWGAKRRIYVEPKAFVKKKKKKKKGKRKVQGVPQSQTAALPRPQEEEETDKSKKAQIEQTYEKH